MIDFIIGDVVKIGEDFVVLQNNNMGYKIFTPSLTMLNIELGEKNIMMFTRLIVREDDMSLYGFLDETGLDMFNLLLLVSRIGPKVAIGVLSTLRPNEIKRAIIKKEPEVLAQAPGIGKKTAERIILELKDRIDENELLIDASFDKEEKEDLINTREAVEALTSLGYTKYEVEKIIKSMDLNNMTVEDIIRDVLKKLSM